MKKIVLIGTYHYYQTGTKPIPNKQSDQIIEQFDAAIEKFRELLISICYEHEITAIAEEMRQSVIDREGKCKSIPCMVATELSIKHQYSDPERKDREKLGICLQRSAIEIKKQTEGWTCEQVIKALRESDEKREQYWFEQLKDLNSWPVLFVCGADHTDYFAKLLTNNEYEVIVENNCWGPNN